MIKNIIKEWSADRLRKQIKTVESFPTKNIRFDELQMMKDELATRNNTTHRNLTVKYVVSLGDNDGWEEFKGSFKGHQVEGHIDPDGNISFYYDGLETNGNDMDDRLMVCQTEYVSIDLEHQQLFHRENIGTEIINGEGFKVQCYFQPPKKMDDGSIRVGGHRVSAIHLSAPEDAEFDYGFTSAVMTQVQAIKLANEIIKGTSDIWE